MDDLRDRPPTATRLRKIVTGAAMASGFAIAIFGVAIDGILTNAEPGLNLPQLLVIVAGLALSLGAWRARRRDVDLRRARRTLAAAALVSLVTLLVIEIALTALDAPVYYPPLEELIFVEQAPFRACNELGCHYDYDETRAACAAGLAAGRHCVVNRQGFSDSQDFVVADEYAQRLRIMTLGDSFTQGYTADIGKSYVETLEALLPEAVVWNTGISGSGTHQALATLRAFAPALKPQLVTLGFVMNDFEDNDAPLDGVVMLDIHEDANFEHFLHGRYLPVRRYFLDRWYIPHELDQRLAYSYRAMGVNPPLNEFERLAGETRLGAMSLRLLDRLAKLALPPRNEYMERMTRGALADLRDAAAAQGSQLLVLVIPRPVDIAEPGWPHRTAVDLFHELGLPYMPLRTLLDPVADYATPPDRHWNTAGHQMVGALLADCARAFFASGSFADCAHVVIP